MIVAIVLIIISVMLNVVLFIFAKLFYELWTIQMARYNGVNRNFLFLNQWMDRKRKNPAKLVNALAERGVTKVAIYGAGYIGRQLYRELKKSEIKVLYYIDRNNWMGGGDIPCYAPSDKLPEVDVIIVSVVYGYDTIEKVLAGKSGAKLIYLEELI